MLALVVSSCGAEGPEVDGGARPSNAVTADATGSSGHAVAGLVPQTGTGTPAIIVLEPRHMAPLPPAAGVPFMDQEARTFVPSILFARTGQPVEFRNSDPEIHNVNIKDALTLRQAFNVAVPTNEKYLYAFADAGIYHVTCDVHAGMESHIVVTSSPYATFADREGRFLFPNVVPGRYEVTAYAGARTLRQTIDVAGPRTEIAFQ
jgi:hypothetical protein